jgi:predicted nucleic acid-binding protein
VKMVLDTRFLAEFFFSQDSKLHREVYRKMEELSENEDTIIPTMAICELTQLVCSREGKQRAEMVYSSITKSGMKIENLTPAIAKEAGILKSTHKNIPTGDCIIAATAIKNQAKILTDDPHYNQIKETKTTWI